MKFFFFPRIIVLVWFLVESLKLPALTIDFYGQTEAFLINHFSNPKNFEEAQNHEPNPLLLAIDQNYPRLVQILLELGTNINLRNKDGISPLLWAVTRNNNRIADILLNHKAITNAPDNKGWTPLMISAQNNNLHLTKSLIEAGANLNATNFEGSSPLLWASRNASLPLVTYLYEEGAEIKHRNSKNQTVAHIATQYGQEEILDYLLKKDPNLALSQDIEGNTPLQKAVQNSRYKMVDILVPYELKGNPHNPLESAIALAQLQGNEEMVVYLRKFLETSIPEEEKEEEKPMPAPPAPVSENLSEDFRSLLSLPEDVRKRILTFLGILDPTAVRSVQIQKKGESTSDLWSGSISYSDKNQIKTQSFNLRIKH